MVEPHLPQGNAIGQQLQTLEGGPPPNPSTWRQTSYWPASPAGAQHLALKVRHRVSAVIPPKGEWRDLYKPALGEGAITRANRYVCTEEGTAVVPRGEPCSIKEAGKGIIKIISFTDNPPPIEPPSTFQQVLIEWGHTWMWEGLQLSGKKDKEVGAWLKEAIESNTLIAITDGSYMKELYPNMNSCAFILECSRGRGRMLGAFSKQTMAACSY